MRIWIDADACPRAVKDIIFRASERRSIAVSVVANKAMHVPASELITMVQVAGGPDVADDHLAEHAEPGDITITADIPLAARLVEREAVVLTPRGEELDEENVAERLSVRDFMTDLRDTGVMTGGPKAFGEKEKRQFANALDRALSRAR
jgi:uncharacterized protein YaiI (UPF0178 family)